MQEKQALLQRPSPCFLCCLDAAGRQLLGLPSDSHAQLLAPLLRRYGMESGEKKESLRRGSCHPAPSCSLRQLPSFFWTEWAQAALSPRSAHRWRLQFPFHLANTFQILDLAFAESGLLQRPGG